MVSYPQTLPDPILASHTPLGANRSVCRAVTWLARTRAVAVVGDDGALCVYVGRDEVMRLQAHQARIFGVCEAERNVVVTAAADGTLRAWAFDPFAWRKKFDPTPMSDVIVPGLGCTALCSLGERSLLVGTKCGRLVRYAWDCGKLLLVEKLQPHVYRVDCVHAHNNLVASASGDNTVLLWRNDCEKLVQVKVLPHSERVYSVTIGDKYITTGTKDFVHLFSNDQSSAFSPAFKVYVGCGIVMSVCWMDRNTVMAACGSILTFVRLENRIKAEQEVSHHDDTSVITRIKTSANILGTALLPEGSIAVVGTDDQSNSIVCLPGNLVQGQHSTQKYPAVCAGIDKDVVDDAVGKKRLSSEMHVASGATVITPKRKRFAPRIKSEPVLSEQLFPQSANNLEVNEKLESLQINLPVVHLRSAVIPESKSPTSVQATLAPSTLTEEGKMSHCSSESLPTALSGNVCELRKWNSAGIEHETLVKLEQEEFVSAMAAYMLRYREGWKELFSPLRDCLLKYFDDNFLSPDDLLGETRVNSKDVFIEIKQAMTKDESIGNRFGLINQAKRFLNEISRDK